MALVREILFRAQTRKYGEKVMMGTGEKLPGRWVYGGIFPGTGDFSVIYGWEEGEEQTGGNLKRFPVYSDTVGQYTGLTDKNGKKIFEGDIFRLPEKPKSKYVVEWDEQGGGFTIFMDACGFYPKRIEVIGNIHDNPELFN